jgi:hypothetical protein
MKAANLFRRRKDPVAEGDVILFELLTSFEDEPGSAAMAGMMFAELDVRPARMILQRLADGRLHAFGVLPRLAAPINTCLVVALENRPAVCVHGSGCRMTKAISRDLTTGSQSPFTYCEKRATNAVFDVLSEKELRA